MATFGITIDDEKIQHLLRGELRSDRGLAALLAPILNQMLQVDHKYPKGVQFCDVSPVVI
jgi:hypothetical protein